MYYLGIDLGGTNIAVGVVDENNKIIARASTKTKIETADQVARRHGRNGLCCFEKRKSYPWMMCRVVSVLLEQPTARPE